MFRARSCKRFERPEAMKPDRVTKIEFTMADAFHILPSRPRRLGGGSGFLVALVDRNPQTLLPNIAYAKPEDFRKATHRVYRSASAPSSVSVGVIPSRE